MTLCHRPVYLPKLGFAVNCGHCPCCRKTQRNTWAMRIQHSVNGFGNYKALFVTLTYMDKYLPANRSLDKKHIQKLNHDLRKYTDRDGIKYKYFVAGEYGPKTDRPHYHILFIGLPIKYSNLIFRLWGKCAPGYYKCEPVLSHKSYRYVAGYTCKKLEKYYNDKFKGTGRIPEFQLVSLGLGKEYLDKVPDELKSKGLHNVPAKHGTTVAALPRYYRKLLGVTVLNNDGFADFVRQKQEAYEEELVQATPEKIIEKRIDQDTGLITLLHLPMYYIVDKMYRDEARRRAIELTQNWRQKIV